MKSYYRVMLGRKSIHAPKCFSDGFIGVGVSFDTDDVSLPERIGDLSGKLPDNYRDFNKIYIPAYLARHPEKTKIAAGLSGGVTWTISKGIKKGDFVLSPNGEGSYRVGEVLGDYFHAPGEILPHRRKVDWFETSIERTSMNDALRSSTGSVRTVCNITDHREEIERLIGDAPAHPKIISSDPEIEDPAAFAMEKHLEEFLVKNWASTELGREFDIYEEEGEQIGQQYPTDTGPMDTLAISKDRKMLLVVELKKGRASDSVVGQVLRYMGFVQEQLAEPDQSVLGVVIALEDDQRLKRELAMVDVIEFYRYEVSFRLVKG